MRVQLLSLTFLVIFFKVCRSNSEEDLTTFIPTLQDTEPEKISLPSGPSLRPFIVDPVTNQRVIVEPISHKLISEIDGKVSVGEDISLQVSLSDESGTIKSCRWTSPDGTVYIVDKDNVDANTVEEVVSNSSDTKTCQITLRNIQEEQFGHWKCRISHNVSSQFQETLLTVTPTEKSLNVRLPRHVRPLKYEIYLTPFIEVGNFTIQGHEKILINVVEGGSNNITIHSDKIQIYENTLKVVGSNEKELKIEGFGYDVERAWFIIFFAEDLVRGDNVTVSIDFLGDLNDDLTGFYRSDYVDDDTNQTVYMATTQFEIDGARRAMPCFDEPSFKAVFTINLGRVKDMTSISNMPVMVEGARMEDNDVYVWDMFENSPLMSTYLLAFVISRFVSNEGTTGPNGVEFKVWSRKAVSDQVEIAAEVGPQILEFYERHYDVPYPLPKMDLVAIPDFSAGAMENWGLITFRETNLLFKEGESGISARENVVTTVAHELAHQWFGNLVTMEWWTDLWLNEGFAHYMQHLGARHAQNNDSGIIDRVVVEGVQTALERDSIESSHPVSVPVNHPDEINEIFDDISYKKGGSLIRMMANFLGVEVFNRGIEHYLKKHQYGNAQQDDLWQALTEIAQESGTLGSNHTLKEIMDTWTVKMGYPVVTVIRSYDTNKRELKISQQRFLRTNGLPVVNKDSSYRWWVPISYTTLEQGFEDPKNSFWMSPEEETKMVYLNESLDSDEPLFINVLQTGFYRVNYDVENWLKISAALLKDHESIHRTNRAQILDDSLTLAREDLLDYPIALETTEYLAKELDYIPWAAAIAEFKYIGKMLGRTAGYGAYKEYMIHKLLPIYKHLGFENKDTDSSMDIELREEVINILCNVGYDDCEEKATVLFRAWKNSSTPGENELPVDLRYTIYCTTIANGKDSDWLFLWNRYRNVANSPSEKKTLLSALSCSTEIWTLQRLLDMSITPSSGIRKQDSNTVISGVAKNKVGRDLTWNWLRANWPAISRYFKAGIDSSLGDIISACASDFNKEFELDELQKFYNEKLSELGTGKRSTESAIEKTLSNIEWMKLHYKEIVDWLEKTNAEAKINLN